MIGIRHAKLTKCQMLDWIKSCLDRCESMPSDDEIIDRFNLSGVESARTLLADLADEGAITIRMAGGKRHIDLGPKEVGPLPMPKLYPNVGRKPPESARENLSVEEGAAKVMAILGRTTPGPLEFQGTPEPPPARSVSDEAVNGSREAETLEPEPVSRAEEDHCTGAKYPPGPGPVIRSGPVPVAGAIRLPTAPGRKPSTPKEPKRQVNVGLDRPVFDALVHRAVAVDKAPGTYARELLTAAIEKPFIPADVVAAAVRANRPVCEFALGLLARGLETYEREGVGR